MSVPPPPPPPASVPLPPPPSMPPPPTPTAAASGNNVAEATTGGVRLDMASLFGEEGKKKKKAVPPWERREKSAPGTGGPSKTAPGKTLNRPKAIPVPSTAAIARPPPSQPSADGPGAPPGTTRSPSPTPCAPPPPSSLAAQASPLGVPAGAAMPPLGSTSTTPSPSPTPTPATAQHHQNTATSSLPNSMPPAQALTSSLQAPMQQALPPPPPMPAMAQNTATELPATTAGGGAPGGCAAADSVPLPSAGQIAQPTAGSSPAAITGPAGATHMPAALASSVQSHHAVQAPTVAYLQAPPTLHSVVKPSQLFYQGEVQTQVVPPIARKHLDAAAAARRGVGADSTAKKEAPAASTSLSAQIKTRTYWRNGYDLQPSPSTRYSATSTMGVCVATSSTTALRQRLGYAAPTTAAAKTSTSTSSSSVPPKPGPSEGALERARSRRRAVAAAEMWRKPYFEHLDVHRYVARRYFGTPPPVEQ